MYQNSSVPAEASYLHFQILKSFGQVAHTAPGGALKGKTVDEVRDTCLVALLSLAIRLPRTDQLPVTPHHASAGPRYASRSQEREKEMDCLPCRLPSCALLRGQTY